MPVSSPKSDSRQALVTYAGRILSARPYFRFKLREKLFQRSEKLGFTDSSQVIDSILDDLQKSGYLQDQYLAQAYIRRQLSKGYGSKIIALKLKLLGLDKSTIASSLSTEASVEAETASLKRFCQKYPRLDRRKLISKLYQRGYSSQVINKVFDWGAVED